MNYLKSLLFKLIKGTEELYETPFYRWGYCTVVVFLGANLIFATKDGTIAAYTLTHPGLYPGLFGLVLAGIMLGLAFGMLLGGIIGGVLTHIKPD